MEFPAAQVVYLNARDLPNPRVMHHVGFGGRTAEVLTDFDLGLGRWRVKAEHGLRRAVWDAAYGYVSGFSLPAITYYVVTRSLSARICRRVLRWEASRVRA